MTNQTILDQLEEVRQDGGTNMLSRKGVQAIANDLELYELVGWCETVNSADYMAALSEL